jgi:hypothetical protein
MIPPLSCGISLKPVHEVFDLVCGARHDDELHLIAVNGLVVLRRPTCNVSGVLEIVGLDRPKLGTHGVSSG